MSLVEEVTCRSSNVYCEAFRFSFDSFYDSAIFINIFLWLCTCFGKFITNNSITNSVFLWWQHLVSLECWVDVSQLGDSNPLQRVVSHGFDINQKGLIFTHGAITLSEFDGEQPAPKKISGTMQPGSASLPVILLIGDGESSPISSKEV